VAAEGAPSATTDGTPEEVPDPSFTLG